MSQSVQALAPAPQLWGRNLPPLLALAWRYGLSVAGPVAVSGAHFLASLLFLRNLDAAEFGLFSFVLVVSAFAMSITAAGLTLPATRSLVKGETDIVDSCFALALWASIGFIAALTVAVMAGGVSFSHALPLGLYGAMLAYRWFARSFAYIEGRVTAAIASDLIYGAAVIAGLFLLHAMEAVSLRHGGTVMLLAAIASMAPFGAGFFRLQLQGLARGRLSAYLPAFRAVTSWSLTGVALTELTLNAHAYLVTFIAGPGAFALPALGMLLMRPSSLVQSSLPDLERPTMMRAVAARDNGALANIMRHFHGALVLALLGNVLLAAGLLAFAPQIVLKHGYNLEQVIPALVLCAAIMVARAARTPPSILLQATGDFKALARLSGWSAAVSLAATLALLLTLGPVASLGGVLAGDLMILVRILPLARAARQALHD